MFFSGVNDAIKHRTEKLKAKIACDVIEKKIQKKHDQKRKIKK